MTEARKELLDTARDYLRQGWSAHEAALLAAEHCDPYRDVVSDAEVKTMFPGYLGHR